MLVSTPALDEAPDGDCSTRAGGALPDRAVLFQQLDDLYDRTRHDAAGTVDATRALLAEIADADAALTGRALHVMGLALAHSNMEIEALNTMQQARDLLQHVPERRLLGRLLRDLSSLLGNQLGQTTEAIIGLEEALSIAVEVGSAIDEGCALNGLGTMFGRLERWDDSERALRRSVELLSGSDVGTDLGSAVNNLSYLLALRHRPDEAIDTLHMVIDRVDPHRDPRTVLMLQGTLALVYAETGDTDQALELLRPDHPALAAADTYLLVARLETAGRVHLMRGDHSAARDCLLESLALADAHEVRALGIECVRHLAIACEQAGDHAAALAYERELRQRERVLLDANAAAVLRRTELALQVEASARENTALEAARAELAARVEERTAELTAEVEERRRAEERAAHLARVDWLTGLPNRRHFEAALAERLHASSPGTVGLCFVDLDHFKGVNDRYGHLAGDEVLQAAAARLSAVAPPGSLVARFGGDEFVVMVGAADACEVERVAAALVKAFATPLGVGSQQMLMNCSVGVAVHPDDGGRADNLLQRADNALLEAKKSGRGCWRRLSSTGWARVAYAAHVLGELAGARDRNELSLAFQPQWRLADGRCDAVEALLRWDHPVLGAVGPSVFIPMAEDGGLIGPIGKWVLERACRAAVELDAAGYAAFTDDWSMSVNVSVRQLQQEGFARELIEVVERSGWRLDRLELELTESLQLSRQELVETNIEVVTAAGARLAIDDFGTGYASFGQLEQLGVTKLKLDRSLIQLLDGVAPRPSLPQAMISLGRSLGMVVVAEGVETRSQLDLLIAQGCDAVQGFATGYPVGVEQLADELLAGLEALRPGSRVR